MTLVTWERFNGSFPLEASCGKFVAMLNKKEVKDSSGDMWARWFVSFSCEGQEPFLNKPLGFMELSCAMEIVEKELVALYTRFS